MSARTLRDAGSSTTAPRRRIANGPSMRSSSDGACRDSLGGTDSTGVSTLPPTVVSTAACYGRIRRSGIRATPGLAHRRHPEAQEWSKTMQTASTTSPDHPQIDLEAVKARQQGAWSSGDYAVVGTTLQIVGEELCEALDVRDGQRVVDVAA